MDGWLNIYKPKDISSAKVVGIVKRVLGRVKIGHCGTLDVSAEGVLPLAIGEATKLVRFLMDARKTYVFTIQFGSKTDSADHTGKVVDTTDVIPSEEAARLVCRKFVGDYTQVPPAFSALKVNGVRSYKLARENRAVELKSRTIHIYRLELLSFDKENSCGTYLAECSKGTYVRTLAEDISLSLQSLGFVIELRRTQVGIFKEEDALTISSELGAPFERERLEEKKVQIEAVLDDIPVLDADELQAKQIRHGQKCFFQLGYALDPVWIRHNGRLLAIGSVNNDCFNSARVFNII